VVYFRPENVIFFLQGRLMRLSHAREMVNRGAPLRRRNFGEPLGKLGDFPDVGPCEHT
jgi:hypothetical protein